jgi:hypothetical protein
VCKTPKPGKIVSGSSTVFINSIPSARIGDKVACGAGATPPGGGSHGPVSIYGVKPEDNYVEASLTGHKPLIEPVSREESQRSSRRRIPSRRTYLNS